jgi:glutamate N-acetyltransferase/amino-acid N-acetyltransferase
MLKLDTAVPGVKGFAVAGIHAGLKKDSKLDMALIVSERECTSGAVFTRNLMKAAPVLVNMDHLQQRGQQMRAVIVNTTNANAATGQVGLENARTMAQLTASQIGCAAEQVYVMSTGVIGAQLPMEKIGAGITLAASQLGNRWDNAAAAIMTTDTWAKVASVRVQSARGEYSIAGISKGAGMIAPNMATMLGVIATDAALPSLQIQSLLGAACDTSFNRIVVDGDTSTNDMVVLLANGASGIQLETAADLAQFQEALNLLTIYLAQQIVRDGEGATKFITIEVNGTQNHADAAQIAHTIAASPLVKTAFYGNDANWGRIVAAAGRAGVQFAPDQTSLWIVPGESIVDGERGLLLFDRGIKADYEESAATAIISNASIYVTLQVGSGQGHAVVWTCDLSHDYVNINGSYRS